MQGANTVGEILGLTNLLTAPSSCPADLSNGSTGPHAISQNEEKQMMLLNANKVPAEKKFVYDGRRGFWGINNQGYYPGEGYDTSTYKKVNVMVEIKNSKPNLGMALPKGKMRMYKADSRGGLQFVAVPHTVDVAPVQV